MTHTLELEIAKLRLKVQLLEDALEVYRQKEEVLKDTLVIPTDLMLTHRQRQVITILRQRPDQVFSKERLWALIGNPDDSPDTVHSHVSKLLARLNAYMKLHGLPTRKWIRCTRFIGYQITPELLALLMAWEQADVEQRTKLNEYRKDRKLDFHSTPDA